MAKTLIIETSTFKTEIALSNNAATSNLIAMLPLTLTFKDFAGKEKITYLPQKLQGNGDKAYKPQVGDFFLYVPWGNVGIFYELQNNPNGDLLHLGKVISGLDSIVAQKSDFVAQMYLVE